MGSSLGVDGGKAVLSTKFKGIDSVQILSPSSATVKWSNLTDYASYNVYTSAQDTPVGNSVFNSLAVKKLKAGTTYSFSVAAVKADGSQDGIGKQIQASTWNPFTGPTSATAKDAASIAVAWSYKSGPIYQVYANAGAPPSAAQLAGPPTATSTSSNGMVVAGLQPNTTYYFAVTAKYADGTNSLDALTAPVSSVSAQYTLSQMLATSLPAISSPASFLNTENPAFTVTGAPGTIVTTFFTGPIGGGYPGVTCPVIANGAGTAILAQRTGSGTAAGAVPLPLALNNVNIQVRDPILGQCAYAVLSNIATVASVATILPTVSATTTSSLSPLPIVTGPGQNLGNFPTFTVAGGLPSYKTTLYTSDLRLGAATTVGSVNGNGNITVLPSTPLPLGTVQVWPVVTAGGQTAYLDPVTVIIRALDTTQVFMGASDLNGAPAGGAGLGTTSATGDFNCDGFMDVALGAPFGSFSRQLDIGFGNNEQLGAVVVYYGSPTGLVGLNPRNGTTPPAPSTTPTAGNPLLIPNPDPRTYSLQGIRFGASLAAGNLARHQVGINKCADLVVGAPGSQSVNGPGEGAIYVYYGSSAGLQVTPTFTENGIGCAQAGSTSCVTGRFSYTSASYVRYPTYYYGFGMSVAAGDFNGDGWDDVAVGAPGVSDKDPVNTADHSGEVELFYGTDNGLSPFPQQIKQPLGFNCAGPCAGSAYFGFQVAFAAMTDPPTAPFTDAIGGSPTPYRKKDLVVVQPFYAGGTGGATAIFRIKGTANLASNIDATGHLKVASLGTQYEVVKPGQCDPASGAYITQGCGLGIAAADVNQDGWDEILVSGPNLGYVAGFYSLGGFFVYYGSPFGIVNPAAIPVANAVTCTASQFYTNCAPQFLYTTDAWEYNYQGRTLANLGDTNGDGYPEIGVGAHAATPARMTPYTYAGLAYLFYSGPFGLTAAGATKFNLSTNKYSFFGTSMAGGNFRNFAYASGACFGKPCNDVLVGAPGESKNSLTLNLGTVHLFQNTGSGFSGTVVADNGYLGDVAGGAANSGMETAMFAGDLNGDGYTDLIAQYRYDGPMSTSFYYEGKVAKYRRNGFVAYFGSTAGLRQQDAGGRGPSYVPITPQDPLLVTDMAFGSTSFADGGLGASLAPAGDVNGDGFADVLCGSSTNVYLFFGSSTGLVAYQLAGGVVSGTLPSKSPSSALDVRIVSGTPGSAVLPGTITATPGLYNDYATSGDFNGDGYGDVVFSNAAYSSPVITVYGSPSGPVTGGAIRFVDDAGYGAEPNPYNKAVRVPTCAVVAGATMCRPLEMCGHAGGTACATYPYSPNWGDYAGNSYPVKVHNGGDLDKNGVDDLIINSMYGDVVATYATGSLYIYYGLAGTGLSAQNYAKIFVPSKHGAADPAIAQLRRLGNGDGYGDIARVPDVNGDGIDELLVTAGYESVGAAATLYSGTAYLIYGLNGGYKAQAGICPGNVYPCTVTMVNPPVGFVPDRQANHLVENSDNSCDPVTHACNPMRFWANLPSLLYVLFGAGALGVGDVTGDGIGDVAVSATYAYSQGAGKLYIFSGSLSGLYVSPAPTTQAICTAGICRPFVTGPPTGAAYNNPTLANMSWRVSMLGGLGDTDKDGRKEFFLRSAFADDPAGKSFNNGGLLFFK